MARLRDPGRTLLAAVLAARGLRVDRLVLPDRRVRAEEKITEAGRLIHGEPKTRQPRRPVTVPEFVALELAEHVREYPRGKGGLVFTVLGATRAPAGVLPHGVEAGDREGRLRGLQAAGPDPSWCGTVRASGTLAVSGRGR